MPKPRKVDPTSGSASPAPDTWFSPKHLLSLHAALDVDAVWSAIGTAMTDAMPHHHFVLALQCIGTMPTTVRLSRPVPDVPQYYAKLDAVAPLAQMARRLKGKGVSRLTDEVPRWLLPLTPFYRKIMKPEGWRYSVALLFWDGDRLLAHFGATRTAAQGDYTDEEMARIEMLYPHFDVAIRRVLLFDRERAARVPLEVSVKDAPLPMAVLDWELREVYTNRAAPEAAACWHGEGDSRALKLDFVLPASIREACDQLRAGWAAAVSSNRTDEATRRLVVEHPSRRGWRALARLLPPSSTQFSEPQFLIEFHHPPDVAADRSATLTSLALLTPMEREVALECARGRDNAGIATSLGISIHTVRAHLRSIFAKLGVQSRAQLIHLLGTAARDGSLQEGRPDGDDAEKISA